jgi:GAF domain-containing protein
MFASRERREPETSMDRLLQAIASHIGQYIEHARLLDELRAAAAAPR